jgi:uncharacterized protein (TIGR00645 family)
MSAPGFERLLQRALFAARWIMAPVYVGLMAALVLLVVVFMRELLEAAPEALHEPRKIVLLILSLIDLSLAGNLILIVTFSGYENFVSKIDAGESGRRLPWMGTIDFSGMKTKLIASIVAISAISLLRAFMQLSGEYEAGEVQYVHRPDASTLAWLAGLHLVFVTTGVIFALMDWLSEKAHVTARAAHAHGSLAEHDPNR